MKKVVKVLPYYEPRMWGGGRRLIDEFHYVTDIAPIGEVYNVVALKNHADCYIPELQMSLAELYESMPDWFKCDTEELPIRVNILDPIADLSIQIHPSDEFAKEYNGGRGKPEAWVILDSVEGGKIQFGHNAKTLDEFVELSINNKWDQLLKYLPVVVDGFIDIPTGTLHAVGEGVLLYNISRNADCTLRLYDYERIDPATNSLRPIQVEEVYKNVNIPDVSTEFVVYPVEEENDIRITRYWDEPGLYTLIRLQMDTGGEFDFPRFCFITCVKGEGTINEVAIIQGETVLVPEGTSKLSFEGKLDLFLASYQNLE